MKAIFTLLVLVSTSIAFAGEKYICKQITASSEDKVTMIITQIGDAKIEEGKKFAFTLELFEVGNSKPVLSEKVTVETEDVMFAFDNKAKKIKGMIYMDELDQAWLYVGTKKYDFDCN